MGKYLKIWLQCKRLVKLKNLYFIVSSSLIYFNVVNIIYLNTDIIIKRCTTFKIRNAFRMHINWIMCKYLVSTFIIWFCKTTINSTREYILLNDSEVLWIQHYEWWLGVMVNSKGIYCYGRNSRCTEDHEDENVPR